MYTKSQGGRIPGPFFMLFCVNVDTTILLVAYLVMLAGTDLASKSR